MPTTVTFFPVDNGDMTLIRFGDVASTTLLIDARIRQAADDPKDSTRDVAKDLRGQLKKDDKGRPYVDAFLISHPDEDHCLGVTRHFYLGPLSEYPDDEKDYKDKKIVIRELWSSAIVFRRASTQHTLCEDAKAICAEARRRVKLYRESKVIGEAGDRIQIMGEDVNGKTDDLGGIVRKVDQSFSTINGSASKWFSAHLLAPLDASDEEAVEECLAKNQSSVIINFTLAANEITPNGVKFLTGGDAEVFIWKRQWERHKHNLEVLEYDLLETPHHCSWHSLSEDSISEKKDKAKVAPDALNALSQARAGAVIVASCKAIKDDECDPPSFRAKEEYESIASGVGGSFLCTGEYPSENAVEPMIFTVTSQGLSKPGKKEAGYKAAGLMSAAVTPLPHGCA
ncbi:metallohydrolase [Comamonas sp. 26]|uniref:metallohydrolase n=1 Tax=Comamonas sp. 26 TaxID=2035201 RepID=UPI000C1844DD|nr:metallohydrolase [Comamonas sp. 26]PIG08295.1 hypothetical protein CLU84_1138 [Comamonas sp. 26]